MFAALDVYAHVRLPRRSRVESSDVFDACPPLDDGGERVLNRVCHHDMTMDRYVAVGVNGDARDRTGFLHCLAKDCAPLSPTDVIYSRVWRSGVWVETKDYPYKTTCQALFNCAKDAKGSYDAYFEDQAWLILRVVRNVALVAFLISARRERRFKTRRPSNFKSDASRHTSTMDERIEPAPPGHVTVAKRREVDQDDGRRFWVGDRIGVCASGNDWTTRPPHPHHADYVRIHYYRYKLEMDAFDAWFAQEYPDLKRLADELMYGEDESPELERRRDLVEAVAMQRGRVRLLLPGTRFYVHGGDETALSIRTEEDVKWRVA